MRVIPYDKLKDRLRKHRFVVKMGYGWRRFLHDSDIAPARIIRSLQRKRRWGTKTGRDRTHFPLVIIETINMCNARCVMCPIAEIGKNRPLGYMGWDLYTKIVDECCYHNAEALGLSNYGEPLLDPLLAERVRYARERGIERVQFFTNGSLLDETKSRELIEAGLYRLNISLDAATKETYERIRHGLDFGQVKGNIRQLVEIRNEMGASNPIISIGFVNMDINSSESAHFVKEWEGLVDKVDIGTYIARRGNTENRKPRKRCSL